MKNCKHGNFPINCSICHYEDEIAALRASVARLEDALKEISTLYWHDAPAPEEMRDIARRALEEK